MIDKKRIFQTSLIFVFLTILALAAVYTMHTHLSTKEASKALQLKITASQEKTILMSAQMAGGIQWNKPASIQNVHVKHAGSEIVAGLTDVLAIDAQENELYSSHPDGNKKVDLNALLKTHRSSIDKARHYSLVTETHMVTMVTVFSRKGESVGYVAMAWLK